MKRLIINNQSDASDALAIDMVSTVIESGKVSDGGKQYCYATVFASGYVVYANRTKNGTHTFTINHKQPE